LHRARRDRAHDDVHPAPLRYFSESGELDHIRGTSESV